MEKLSFGDEKKKTFAEIIIAELRERELTQQDIANQIGENYNNLKSYLYGHRPIKESVAKKLCNYLNLDYEEAIKNDPYLNPLNYYEPISFGQKLKALLRNKNIGFDEFAEGVGISTGTLSYIINGNKIIKLETICKICSYLNTNIYDMIKDDPQYILIKNQFNTSTIHLLNEAGIVNPISNYEEVLIKLIKANKYLFMAND